MSGARVPVVALLGRQNVGKSTLANRLAGRREAIAHELPGVTRDRVEIQTTWRGRTFALVDTGGYVRGARGIDALVAGQAERAAGSADVVLLVVDVQRGPSEEDSALAGRLRRVATPVLLVANKVDTDREDADASTFYALGLGEPNPVSAQNGRGSGELLDRIVELLPRGAAALEEETEPRFGIVGRPNVGKSSLFNRLVGEERSVVYEEAGTTRDAVDALVTWPSGPVRFVDTAGFRRPSQSQGIEYYSFLRAMRAIERAHVVVLVLDATDGFTAEDRRIAARVMKAGRALTLVANKWDLVVEKERTYGGLREASESFAGASVTRASALTGAGVAKLPAGLRSLHERWSRRVTTAEVNRLLREVQGERPAPGRARYRYATQVSAGPPTIVVFGGKAPDAPYRRFLESRLRRAYGFEGVPIRLRFRGKEGRGG